MAAYYSIIQYVPDPLIDERVNAGILVFDERRVRVRFVRNWVRLRRFGNKDVGFLKSFAEEWTDRCQATLFQDGRITPEMIYRVAATWQNSIQLTEPRGSLLDLNALFKDTETRFLAGDRPTQLRPLTRNSLRAFALAAADTAFVRRGGAMARQYIRPKYELMGKIEPHQFSIGIANGHPYAAAEVFSFVGRDERGEKRDVRAGAWAFDDVRKEYPDLPLAALVLRDQRTTASYNEAVRIFTGLNVKVVPKQDVPAWIEQVAQQVLSER